MIYLKDQVVIDEYHKMEPKADLIRIQKAIFVYRDMFFNLDECGHIWQNYSWALAASWLFIPKDYISIIKQIESTYHFKSYEEWAKE